MSPSLAALLAAVLGICGGGGGLLAWLNRKPDLATKMVAQAAAVVDTMQALNEELGKALEKCQRSLARAELALQRAEAREDALTAEIKALRGDVARLQATVDRDGG